MSERVVIEVKGVKYNLPPLNAGQIRDNWDALASVINEIQSAPATEQFHLFGPMVTGMSDIVWLALSNEYPNVSKADVDTLLVGDLQEILPKLIEVTSLGRSSTGEATAPRSRKK